MGATEIIAALQAVNQGISSIAQAPELPPLTLDGSVLPCALVKPGLARWWGGGGLRSRVRAKRLYSVLYFVAATSADAQNDADLHTTVLPIIEDVMEVWRNTASLGNPQIAMVMHHDNTTEALTDHGPALLVYASDAAVYYGFQVDLVVQEIAS